eukprot:jgi/Undpi1/13761/HiC_scaffold_9.g03412.m1
MSGTPRVSVVLTEGYDGGVGSALRRRLTELGGGGRTSKVRSSPVLCLDGLMDICRGADIVYLLSAIELPDSPDASDLQDFRAAVNRVVQCCQESGVGAFVFISSSKVVSSRNGLDLSDENVPFVTSQEDETAHAIASAEAVALNARQETRRYLRPLRRVLGWIGWGLNRVALGCDNVQSDMVYVDNLVEAQVLAGNKLMEGVANAQAEGGEWVTHAPACSGQAYFVTDGRPCNLQAFADGVLDGLEFSTSKIVRVPKIVALAAAGVAELACKVGLTGTPLLTRKEVRTLTENRTLSIARIQADLGYEPIVDPGAALVSTVKELKEDGWGRHTILTPGLGYWIVIPFYLWFLAIAGFEGMCPGFLAPVQKACP